MGYSNILTLTGLPCSGKTTIGNNLAKKLNYNFIDLDNYITIKHNKSINDIFNLFGEDKFRELESNALIEILSNTQSKLKLVLSLGGGTICFYNNLKLCLNKTVLIWLNTSFNTIYSRLLKCNNINRPIFINNNLYTKLLELYNKRLHFYNKSHIKINITEDNLNYNIDNILENMNNYYGN